MKACCHVSLPSASEVPMIAYHRTSSGFFLLSRVLPSPQCAAQAVPGRYPHGLHACSSGAGRFQTEFHSVLRIFRPRARFCVHSQSSRLELPGNHPAASTAAQQSLPASCRICRLARRGCLEISPNQGASASWFSLSKSPKAWQA